MSDYTKFLLIKNQLQKFYNFKAKEEREILYATKILENINVGNVPNHISNTIKDQSNSIYDGGKILLTETFSGEFTSREKTISEKKINIINELISINHLKSIYYIEFLRIDKDISFKFSCNFELLLKMTIVTNEDITLRIGDKDVDVKFYNNINLKEFVWCIIKLISIKKLENQVQIKGINYKDLEDFAYKNKFYLFNKIFEEERKKERYEIEVTDKELEDLEYTLKSLNIDSIISYDLENLNSKIEQFNISTKESFLKRLQGKFTDDVNLFLNEIKNLDNKINNQAKSLDSDMSSISDIWYGIQKIEDANHRIELRQENKRKTFDFMQKLLDQLTISKSKEENLTNCRYLSNSELEIVNEVLDKFVKFYKSRKKQDIKMTVIKEGHDRIKKIIESMISNFNINIYEYIRSHMYKETYLLKNLPSFSNTKLVIYMKEACDKLNKNRSYLENFIIDRKFFIEKLNILVNNQDDLNKTKIFKDCVTILSKGMRDALAVEFNGGIKILQIFFDCDILDMDKLDIYLSGDDLLKYDAFEKIETDLIYECNKYFTTFILNCFFAADKCLEILQNFFSEEPNFFLDKTSKYYEEIEKIVTQKIYEYLSKNFNTSIEKNILLGFVTYSVLSAVQERISKNVIEDMIVLSVKDAFEYSYKLDDTYLGNFNDNDQNDNFKRLDMEEVGIRKISLQETKNFIVKNMKTLQTIINSFLNEQKQIITDYTVEVRRVGVIPIVKKTTNFFKILLCLTRGIKQDFIFEIIEDCRTKLRYTIERHSKVNAKYTNIILIENYYYIANTCKSGENYNICHALLSKMETESFNIYNKFKDDYIREIFEYQYKDFSSYYDKFNIQYNNLGEQVRVQSNFTFQSFDKITINFLKELTKGIEKMAKRVNKHFCKELGLGTVIWVEASIFIKNILDNIEGIYKNCYGKEIEAKWLHSANDNLNNFNFASFKK